MKNKQSKNQRLLSLKLFIWLDFIFGFMSYDLYIHQYRRLEKFKYYMHEK